MHIRVENAHRIIERIDEGPAKGVQGGLQADGVLVMDNVEPVAPHALHILLQILTLHITYIIKAAEANSHNRPINQPTKQFLPWIQKAAERFLLVSRNRLQPVIKDLTDPRR